MRSINRHVSLLFRMGERYLTAALADTQISAGTAQLILSMKALGPCRLAALAAEVGVDRAYVTRAVRSLEAAGIVEVTSGDGGERSRTVRLTDAGLDAARRVEEVTLAWIDIITAGVDPADLVTVQAAFDQFYANARRHLVDPDTA